MCCLTKAKLGVASFSRRVLKPMWVDAPQHYGSVYLTTPYYCTTYWTLYGPYIASRNATVLTICLRCPLINPLGHVSFHHPSPARRGGKARRASDSSLRAQDDSAAGLVNVAAEPLTPEPERLSGPRCVLALASACARADTQYIQYFGTNECFLKSVWTAYAP